MLAALTVRDIVLIEQAALEFAPGLNVLTGETGAGKSIWVDAVALALGARADTSVIRQGQSRCDISVCFDLHTIPSARAWLSEQTKKKFEAAKRAAIGK